MIKHQHNQVNYQHADINTQGISAIPEIQEMHSVNVISPFIIETKELFYADIHT